jgi:hypothetical protein
MASAHVFRSHLHHAAIQITAIVIIIQCNKEQLSPVIPTGESTNLPGRLRPPGGTYLKIKKEKLLILILSE